MLIEHSVRKLIGPIRECERICKFKNERTSAVLNILIGALMLPAGSYRTKQLKCLTKTSSTKATRQGPLEVLAYIHDNQHDSRSKLKVELKV